MPKGDGVTEAALARRKLQGLSPGGEALRA
jgi:hypothetical protein